MYSFYEWELPETWACASALIISAITLALSYAISEVSDWILGSDPSPCLGGSSAGEFSFEFLE
jgi:hypothetical protein